MSSNKYLLSFFSTLQLLVSFIICHRDNQPLFYINGRFKRQSASTVSHSHCPIIHEQWLSTPPSTLTLIPNLPSPTSLQVAAAAYSLSNGTALAVGGCSQQDGTNNCAAACTDLTQVFSDVRTFQNCLAFPTITQILSTINVTDEFKSTAAAYGIAMTDNVTTFNVKENIGKCLAGYCNSSPTCYEFRTPDSACYNLSMSTVTSKIFPITLDGYDYENETSFYQDANTVRSELAQNFSVSINRGTLGCIQALCENVKRTATVDTDIGGIGVY